MVHLSPSANCCGSASRVWYHGLRVLRRKDVSAREVIGLRHNNVTVIAVGGNSIGELEVPTVDNILLFRAPVITHGNGPQVGKLVVDHPTWTLHQCGRQTQDDIGNALKADIEAKLRERGRSETVEVIPTRMIVSADDPAFKNPTKPIGVFYSWEEMQALGTVREIGEDFYQVEGRNWFIRKIKGAKQADKPYRRVVASPKPLEIHPEDFERIKAGAREGNIVIACGGGGVPYARFADGSLSPVEAVIDKDLASALLAIQLEAREMIISTGVPRVTHNFGTPQEVGIDYTMAGYAVEALKEGQYPAGSMGEKVEAAVNAVRGGVNEVLITHPHRIWIKFEGTLFTRGLDLLGRLHNLAKMFGLAPKGLQRWLV